jgi:hypothetical protein
MNPNVDVLVNILDMIEREPAQRHYVYTINVALNNRVNMPRLIRVRFMLNEFEIEYQEGDQPSMDAWNDNQAVFINGIRARGITIQEIPTNNPQRRLYRIERNGQEIGGFDTAYITVLDILERDKVDRNLLYHFANQIGAASACISCENPSARQMCSQCRSAVYCNKSCQAKDWLVHQLTCGNL